MTWTFLKILNTGLISSRKCEVEILENLEYRIMSTANEIRILYFQLKELKHLKYIFIFSRRSLNITSVFYFQLRETQTFEFSCHVQLKESPPPTTFQLPPLHQPPSWGHERPWGTRVRLVKSGFCELESMNSLIDQSIY